MVPRSLFIHATNVHQGGGRFLLAAMLNILPSSMKSILSLDNRMPIPEGMAHSVQIKRVKPTLLQRFLAEKWLARSVTPEDIVLCFGNLPPLFKLRGRALVFVQNRYLIDDVRLSEFSFKVRLRLAIERLWLSTKMGHVDEFVVQTPTMKRLLEKRSAGKIPVRILPFLADLGGYSRTVPQPVMLEKKDFDFVYVASGEPHKNHRRLIEAWHLLAIEGLFPTLCLTLSETDSTDLCRWIDENKIKHGLKVENLGLLPHDQVKQLYRRVGALIYPSTFESFGLPLIEARQAGLPVLAAETDYVRDVLDPEQSFDPQSAMSIARAVKRHLGFDEQPLQLLNADDFIKRVLQG